MSEPKHTSGPWHIETVSTAVGHCHKIQPLQACLYVDNQTLPHDAINYDSTLTLANVRLIAAAPELLAALEGMSRWMDMVYAWDKPVPREHLDEMNAARAAYDKATTAIAKATGAAV